MAIRKVAIEDLLSLAPSVELVDSVGWNHSKTMQEPLRFPMTPREFCLILSCGFIGIRPFKLDRITSSAFLKIFASLRTVTSKCSSQHGKRASFKLKVHAAGLLVPNQEGIEMQNLKP